jgi:hypothetical protein
MLQVIASSVFVTMSFAFHMMHVILSVCIGCYEKLGAYYWVISPLRVSCRNKEMVTSLNRYMVDMVTQQQMHILAKVTYNASR